MKTCTKCGETKPPEEFHRDRSVSDGRVAQCKACAKARRAELKAQGLCTHHPGRPAAHGATLCEECIEYHRAHSRARRAELKAQGRCPNHPDRLVGGATLCEECLERKHERTAELKAQGLCPGHPDRPAAAGATACEECLERQRERQAETRAQRRARTPEELAADQAAACPRRCPGCKRTLSREWWGTAVNEASGLRAYCLKCSARRTAKRDAKLHASIPEHAADQKLEESVDARIYWSKRTGVDHEVDHIIPRSRGGTHEWANLRLLPQSLNGSKGPKLDEEMPDGGDAVRAASFPIATALWEHDANAPIESGETLPYRFEDAIIFPAVSRVA